MEEMKFKCIGESLDTNVALISSKCQDNTPEIGPAIGRETVFGLSNWALSASGCDGRQKEKEQDTVIASLRKTNGAKIAPPPDGTTTCGYYSVRHLRTTTYMLRFAPPLCHTNETDLRAVPRIGYTLREYSSAGGWAPHCTRETLRGESFRCVYAKIPWKKYARINSQCFGHGAPVRFHHLLEELRAHHFMRIAVIACFQCLRVNTECKNGPRHTQG